MNIIITIGVILFAVILIVAAIKSRRANPEQSSVDMHPTNFQKPEIERVEKDIKQNHYKDEQQ